MNFIKRFFYKRRKQQALDNLTPEITNLMQKNGEEITVAFNLEKVIASQITDEKIAKSENGPKYSINQRIRSMMQHFERIHGRKPHHAASLKIKEAAYNEQIWLQNT